jgi:hypothetical protein
VLLPQRIIEGVAVSLALATLYGFGRLIILARRK